MKLLSIIFATLLLSACGNDGFRALSAPGFLFPSAQMKQEIEDTFFESEALIRPCYENQLQQKPGLQGNVVLTFLLNDRGEVVNPSSSKEKSTLNDKDIDTCLFNAMLEFDFPTAPKDQFIQVEYEVSFFPKE